MILRSAAALAVALLLASCGADDDGRYDAQIGQVRSAVEVGDRATALASLDELGADAFAAHAAGDVSDDELAELAGLLDHARAQIDAELPPPTTTEAPTTTTTAAPPAPAFDTDTDSGDDDDGDEDEKDEKSRGNGRGGDDGDDDDDDD